MSSPLSRVNQSSGVNPAPPEKRSRLSVSASGGSRKLTMAFPAATLGQISDLPDDRILPNALDAVARLHGGWGCVVFSVEDAVALSHESAEESADGSVSYALNPECVVAVPLLQEKFLHASGDLLVQTCERVAAKVIEAKVALSLPSTLAGQTCLVMAVPVLERGKVTSILCRVHDLKQTAEMGPLAALQSVGLLHLVSKARGSHRAMIRRFGKVAAFVELLAASEGGVDFSECARNLANHLCEVMECDTVALSVNRRGSQHLAAVSGEAGPSEAHSPGRRALLSHLTEVVHRGRLCIARRDEGGNSAASGLRQWFDPALSLCLPLIDAQGKTRGAWLFLWKEEPDDLVEKESLLRAATPEVAPLLSLLYRAKPGAAIGGIKRLWIRGTLTQRHLAVAVGVAALIGLLVPFPYPVKAKCELQPVVRRVIASPFDGTLRQSFVRAGEVVTRDQILAEMDGREIRSQLSEALAQRERATKESDHALSQGHIAEARISALEAEGLDYHIELLKYRQDHLEVRSPIDGLVLRGDLERSEGAPLRVGDTLYEVGPLDRLVAEVAVPASEISLVEIGAKVDLKLESRVNLTVESTILRIAPKSEWLDEANVFLCEAEIENPENQLRAGLKGKAKVAGPRRPLIWNLCRDGWLALRYRLW
ncbi:MAG TPA: HlyD family efflux transporter periplasmic adaptor subunit [Verrucomicrobiales bacterium]|nr:HlyD family efflux transporter periplasmic adaptor subunit [Verrucomicrobiales bacterium]